MNTIEHRLCRAAARLHLLMALMLQGVRFSDCLGLVALPLTCSRDFGSFMLLTVGNIPSSSNMFHSQLRSLGLILPKLFDFFPLPSSNNVPYIYLLEKLVQYLFPFLIENRLFSHTKHSITGSSPTTPSQLPRPLIHFS